MQKAAISRRGAAPGSGTLPRRPQPGTASNLLDDFVLERIEYHARRLAKTFSLPDEDRDDVRQDMMVEVLSAAKRFNSTQATWHTFVCGVLNRFVKSYSRDEGVRRKHETAHPTGGRAAGDDEVASAFEAVADEHDDIAEVELRLDTEAVLASLPPRLRRLCELLKVKTPAEAAAEMGIHHNSIYRLTAMARRHFKAAGLDFPETGAADSPLPQI